MTEGRDAFYVGYDAHPPAGLMRFVRGRVKLVILLAVVLAVGMAALQRPFSDATFEYGNERELVGWLQAEPFPSLLVPRPGSDSFSRYLLVGFGKRGASDAALELRGKRVRARGTLIYRGGHTMVELSGVPEELPAGPEDRAPGRDPGEDLGPRSFVGEIVDSKCFLGVMKPGNLKTHRACAARCISGGVPPVLLVRAPNGSARTLVLRDAEGGPVGRELLDLVAEPVAVEGRLLRYGEALVLRADVSAFRRLEERP